MQRFIYIILFLIIYSCGPTEDCNGVVGGTAYTDDCGQCVGGMTGLVENYLMDECGVCEGEGAIFECGCYDIINPECDCDGNVLDECGECGGDYYQYP